MKKIMGMVAVAALLLVACSTGPTATETGVPTVEPTLGVEAQMPEDLLTGTDPCKTKYPKPTQAGQMLSGFFPLALDPNLAKTGDWADKIGGVSYRYVYSSILADENDVVAVCATAVFPKGKTVAESTKVMNWAHGTVGVVPNCVPFRKTEGMAQDARSGGLGDDGGGFNALAELLRNGYAVLATDYYSGPNLGGTFPYQAYAAGIASGAQVLDAMRAVYDTLAPNAAVEYVTWGHSQGGGSSLFAGQLGAKYLPGNYQMRGVLAAAPASQFVATADQPEAWDGFHLGDQDAYNYIVRAVPIGDVLFSFVMQPWSQPKLQGKGTLSSLPPGKPLKLDAVLTAEGNKASAAVARGLCLSDPKSWDSINSFAALAPFGGLVKEAKPFFSRPFQGIFLARTPGYSISDIDGSCVQRKKGDAPVASVANWCAAMAWNMPGPNGTNPNIDKMPADSVPMFLASGTQDNVVWCTSVPKNLNPPKAVDCLMQQYAESTNRTINGPNLTVKYYDTTPNGKAPDHFGVMQSSAQDSVTFIKGVLN